MRQVGPLLLGIALAFAVLGACSAPPASHEAFCSVAIPMFDQEPEVPIPLLLRHMATLAAAAETLPEGSSGRLLNEIATLTADLEAWERGEAENGYSSVPVVNAVGDLCEADNLFGWTAQP